MRYEDQLKGLSRISEADLWKESFLFQQTNYIQIALLIHWSFLQILFCYFYCSSVPHCRLLNMKLCNKMVIRMNRKKQILYLYLEYLYLIFHPILYVCYCK